MCFRATNILCSLSAVIFFALTIPAIGIACCRGDLVPRIYERVMPSGKITYDGVEMIGVDSATLNWQGYFAGRMRGQGCGMGVFAWNSQNVYYEGKLMIEANPKEFVDMGGEYSKSAGHIYFSEVILPDVDLKTFRVEKIHGRYGTDKKFIYVGGEKFPLKQLKIKPGRKIGPYVLPGLLKVGPYQWPDRWPYPGVTFRSSRVRGPMDSIFDIIHQRYILQERLKGLLLL